MRCEAATASSVAMRVLERRFGADTTRAVEERGLAAFQRDAVQRLHTALMRYRGAILADSVGLGKTHVGAALAKRALDAGDSALVVAPPALRRQWIRAVRDVRVQVVSHAALSRNAGRRQHPGARLLVVDEAHAFRNPATRRYRTLAELARGARVLLITATPVNNSLDDLYWLLRLFAGDGSFAALGIPDLRACFEHARRSGGAGRLPAVLAQVMVRRTRSLLLDLHGTLEIAGAAWRFPERKPPAAVPYAPPGSWRSLLRTIDELELSAWSDHGQRGAGLLLRLMLLRRAESSRAAALVSFSAVHDALTRMAEALRQGLDPRSARLRLSARTEQLALAPLLLAPLAAGTDVGALLAAIERDRTRLGEAIAAIGADVDAKLAALVDLLESLRGRSVIVFTEFRDTAEYLHGALRDRARIGLVHGAGARLGAAPAGRRSVIERFAPTANGARVPPARERIQLLIATDVLAEGLNLHDAADVISYDLPWNPVRLIQRIGRIDRLGSRHPSIRSYHFVPDRDLERTLGVMRRLRRKLHAIGCTIGTEDAVLAPPRRDVVAVMRGSAAALERVERHDALTFDVEERLRAAYCRQRQHTTRGLPLFPDTEPPDDRVNGAGRGSACPSAERSGCIPVGNVKIGLALPAALRRGRGVLVCAFVEGGGFGRALLARGRRVVEDDRTTGAILLAALESGVHCGTPADEVVSAGCRTARQALAGWAEPCPDPPTRGVVPAVRRRLLTLLEQIPGGASEEECTRVATLVHALAHTTAGIEEVLRRRLRQLRALQLEALCAAVEAVIDSSKGEPADLLSAPAGEETGTRTAPDRRVLGVLVVDPVSARG